jgi:hypothetical protein
MPPQQLLDSIPIPLVFVLIAVVLLISFELGFRVGGWWQERTPGEQEGPTGTLVGSLLALMAFLLAITMGMASDRFDARRGLVLAEANAIGTAYLRAGYLPAPYGEQSRELLREYVPLRINTSDRASLAANIARSEEIHAELWPLAEAVARDHSSDANALYIESLNEVIDLHASRITAGIYARVPETILLLLLGGSALTLAMVGYGAGLTGRRSPLTAVVVVIALAAVLTIVVDLDRPREGFIQVNQQPLIDLQRQLGPP